MAFRARAGGGGTLGLILFCVPRFVFFDSSAYYVHRFVGGGE